MILKKILAATLGITMLFSLTACGGGSNPEISEQGDVSHEKPVTEESGDETGEVEVSGDTLTVAIWDKNQAAGIEEIIKDFTADTGIKVKVQVTPWEQYWTMLEAGATGGSLPDVFWMHSNEIARYSEYEMLLDLTDQIGASNKIDLSKFPEDIVQIYNWEGKQYAMPKDIDTIALWYNKTMFDEAGLAYPDESWTWDTFKDATSKLTKDDGSQFGYALKPSNNQDGWYNTVYSMGGEIISSDKKTSGMDKEGTIKALELITGIVKDGHTPSYETMTENNPEALFEAGKVAMITMGSWMLPELCNNDYVKEHGEIALLPKDATTGRRVSIYNGLGWAAAGNTNKAEEAWKLIEHLGTEQAQQKQSDLGVVISAYEGTMDNWIKAYPDFNLQAYLDMLDDLAIRPYSKSTLTWENITSDKLVDAWMGSKEVKDVCAEIAVEMNQVLAEE